MVDQLAPVEGVLAAARDRLAGLTVEEPQIDDIVRRMYEGQPVA